MVADDAAMAAPRASPEWATLGRRTSVDAGLKIGDRLQAT
jgi:hypothetical protein